MDISWVIFGVSTTFNIIIAASLVAMCHFETDPIHMTFLCSHNNSNRFSIYIAPGFSYGKISLCCNT